jgi:heme oxygenase
MTALPFTTGALSRRLRDETRELHTAAERSGVMHRLLRGRLSRPAYVALLENLAELYRALEHALDRNRENGALSWLDLGALRRIDALESDIGVWRRAGDPADTIRPATREYVDRLRGIAAEAPELLLAHAYVRYLGDLSGGQLLRPIVERTLGAEAEGGTAFYVFADIDDVARFKEGFRANLDAIRDPSLADRLIAEAKGAFVLHERLFRELELPDEP